MHAQQIGETSKSLPNETTHKIEEQTATSSGHQISVTSLCKDHWGKIALMIISLAVIALAAFAFFGVCGMGGIAGLTAIPFSAIEISATVALYGNCILLLAGACLFVYLSVKLYREINRNKQKQETENVPEGAASSEVAPSPSTPPRVTREIATMTTPGLNPKQETPKRTVRSDAATDPKTPAPKTPPRPTRETGVGSSPMPTPVTPLSLANAPSTAAPAPVTLHASLSFDDSKIDTNGFAAIVQEPKKPQITPPPSPRNATSAASGTTAASLPVPGVTPRKLSLNGLESLLNGKQLTPTHASTSSVSVSTSFAASSTSSLRTSSGGLGSLLGGLTLASTISATVDALNSSTPGTAAAIATTMGPPPAKALQRRGSDPGNGGSALPPKHSGTPRGTQSSTFTFATPAPAKAQPPPTSPA